MSSRAQLVSYKYRSVKKKTVSKLEETTAVSQCELYTATDRGVRAASVESRPSSDRFRSISDNIFSSRHHTRAINAAFSTEYFQTQTSADTDERDIIISYTALVSLKK